MNTQSQTTGFEIAVIGMAGRFPGAKNIDEFWYNLKNGIESISFLTDEELKEAGVGADLINNPNYVRSRGGILEGKEYFDASFFNYTPAEAEVMDPQARIFHECSWEALENAGYDPLSYDGAVGLYAGASSSLEWEALSLLSGKSDEMGIFSAGQLTDKDFMSTRISYKLDLRGPAVVVQTACSTSLVAIHMACRALLMGECDMALAGGVTLSSKNKTGYLYREGLVNSPDGHCRAFDAEARGFVGGSGAGVVVLKRLKYATAHRDHIHAVIKGSSVNNDGIRKVGYSAPGIEGQIGVIKTALHVGKVEPESITYVEAHGTATVLGDPVEVEALKQAFNTDKKSFCGIGSVKTNVGHLDAAAGVAGFIKTVLALKYRMLPPTLNFNTPNPKIDFNNSPFYVNDRLKEWKNDRYPLRAGVSSFGIGGTNAHVIVEEWSDGHSSEISAWRMAHGARSHLILLSAKTETALDKMTENLADYFNQNPDINLADAAYTLQTGRRLFKYRRKLVCSSTAEAAEALSSGNTRKTRTFAAGDEERPVIFMFSGLGAQYVNMGRDLYEKEPLFRQEMDRCFDILKPIMGYNIKEILYPEEATKTPGHQDNGASIGSPRRGVNQTEIAQLVIFIFEYALAKLIMKWGIPPHAMIGYSFGEYTAACLSGVFSLEDALKLVAARGELVRQTPEGKMVSVPLPGKELQSLLTEELSIAIDNGPSCIINGPAAAVDAFEKQMKAKRYLCIPLQANRAIHSKMMTPILKEFEGLVRGVRLSKPQIPYISNVTGTWIKTNDASDPRYWARHLGETVRFADGIKELAKEKNAIFVEIGPARDLNAMVRRYIEDNPNQHIINLVRHPETNVSDHVYLLNKIGELWLYGKTIDWTECHKEEKRYRIPLPTYPFERKRYWIEGDTFTYAAEKLSGASRLTREKEIAEWFYLPVWKQAPLLPLMRKSPIRPCQWLVFVEVKSDGFGSLVVEQLNRSGHAVITVTPGTEFKKQEKRSYTITPGDPVHYSKLVRDLEAAGSAPTRILHLWGLTDQDNLDYGFYSLVYLAQAISRAGITRDIKIEVVTCNMQDIVGNEEINPSKATVLGAVKVIPQEYSNIRCRSIDLDFSGPSSEKIPIDQLLEELTTNSHSQDTVIAYRGRHRWKRVFEPLPLDETMENTPPLKQGGVYLITGGLGNIGLVLARYLVQHYRAKLVLTGRSVSTRPKIEKVKKLEELGGEVLVFAADAADPGKMGEVVRKAEQTFGKINGVIHAAGLIKGPSIGTIHKIKKQDCEKQFRAKVHGLEVLENLFQDKKLDFCWLMSSIAAVLGGLQFIAYSAANNFMDAFVQRHNRSNRNRWIAVNWDLMKPEETVTAFRRILSIEKINQVVVSTGGNLQGRIDQWIKLESLGQEDTDADDEEGKKVFHPKPDLLTPYVEPRSQEEQVLADILSSLFGFEEIGVHDDFFELGGDSLKAITVIYKIHKKLNREIPLPVFFERRTIEKLAEYLKKGEKGKYTAVEPVEKKEYYPLSSTQKRLFILQQLEGENTVYNMVSFFTLEGYLEKETFESSFKGVLKRHENLRTSLRLIGEEPVQEILDTVAFEIEYYDMTHSTPAARTIRNLVRPFDLSKPPLLRVGLIKLEEEKHILMLDMPHAISDGISTDIFVRDFISMVRGEEPSPLKLHYKDYAQWKNSEEERERIKQQQDYWLKEFEGEIPVLHLPTDFPRPAIQVFEGSAIGFGISREETTAFNQITLEQGVTLFMLILAVTNIFLSKLSSQEDIVIGTPIAGRRHTDLEQVMGMFVNTLALRNYPEGEKTFKAFLNELKEKTLDALENQDYPFEDLVEQAAVTRDMSRNPLFDVMFVMQNVEFGKIEIPGLQLMPYPYENPFTKFDLTLSCTEVGGRLFFKFEYCTKLFKKETIERFISYFKKVLFSILNSTGIKIGELEIITTEEKRRLLFDFNNTVAEYPKDKTIHGLFEEQAERTGDRVAVIGLEHMITYGELNKKSNQLAFLLKEKGVMPNTIVGIMMEPSMQIVIGIFGILKSGGAYLPIDPDYPEERIKYMLADSNANVLLTNLPEGHRFNCQLSIVNYQLSMSSQQAFLHHSSDQFINHHSGNLAYVIYTSGTTGNPKGVMLNHRAVVNYTWWAIANYIKKETINFPLYTSLSFDLTVTSIFPPLLSGNSVVVYAEEQAEGAFLIDKIVEESTVGAVKVTPSHLKLIRNKTIETPAARRVKRFIVGGEELDTPLAADIYNNFKGNVEIYNEYGPTEAAVGCMIHRFDPGNGSRSTVPIGIPAANVQIYLLDRKHRPVPQGVEGEIYISGDGIARGYMNQPELTAEKFDQDFQLTSQPLYPSIPLYRTGDLARWLPDGNFEFLGRMDEQVKIRGFRIELGEIENRLLNHSKIDEAMVIAKEGRERDKYLCAYIAAGSMELGTWSEMSAELREYLSRSLPDYMIPAYFVQIDRIPLTPNGKVDRKALPEPEIKAGKQYIAPRNEIEKKLVNIWSEVLGIQEPIANGIGIGISISIDDNFFHLGGHSLKATLMVAKVHKELNVRIPLSEVFKTPFIRGLAAYLGQSRKDQYVSIEPMEEKEYYALSSAQKRLYFLQQMDLQSTSYNMPFVLPIGKDIEKSKLESAFKKLIARHESLRTSFERVDGVPVQKVYKAHEVEFKMEYYDLSKTGRNSPGSEIIIQNSFMRAFDLSQAPLMRSGLIKRPDSNYIWMVDIHHIVSDGTSHTILAEDFISLYKGEELEPLELQYKDFSQWQNRLFESGEIKNQMDYWLNLYSDLGEIPRLHLPTDDKRPEVFTFAGDNYSFMLEPGEVEKFRALGTRNGGTLYMNLLASLNTLFYGYTGHTDIIIGSGIAGRPLDEFQNIIGMFVNTLAMRNYPRGEKTYESFFKEVIAHSMQAFENQDVQFEELVDRLDPERDPSRNPLFDVAMVVQNFRQFSKGAVLPFPENNLPPVEYKNKTTKFDITFFVYEYGEYGEDIYITIEYYTGIFRPETIKRLTSHFKNVIKAVVKNPCIRLKDIEIISAEERKQMLYEWNDTAQEYPKDKTIHQLFEEQVEKAPNRTAVEYKNEYLSYGELDGKANQLANYLVLEKGTLPDGPVGILMDRSFDLIAAMLGILKAGGAYIPIDPSSPEKRIKNIINDAGIKVAISQKRYIRTLNRLQWECGCFHTFLCMDSTSIYEEEEGEKNELMDEKLWDYVGESATDEITGGGWVSSYTGEPFSKQEMDEYGDNILKKLTPLLHQQMRVLEIGCASGITMYRIAPKVGVYYGTDLSAVIIEKNKEKIKKEGHQNIVLSGVPAHQIDQIREKSFDLIILNSVIQSFHGHNYLRKVIGKSIHLLAEKGYIFIGDIMDHDLKEALIREMKDFKQVNRDRVDISKTKVDWSSELFVSRSFFEDLALEIPGICGMEFSDKIYTIENELTKFRYDLLLKIDKNKTRSKSKPKRKRKYQHDLTLLRSFRTDKSMEGVKSQDLAYIIYTSGTTGAPKGVMIEHQSLVNYILWGIRHYINDNNKADNFYFPLYTSISFDLTVTSIFLPLISGNTIKIYDDGQTGLPILDVFEDGAVNIVKATPSHLKLLQDELMSMTRKPNLNLKKFIVGGEAFGANLARDIYYSFSRRIEIYNEYGPTEATVGCMIYKFEDDDERDKREVVSIGVPADNVKIYILDRNRKPLPINAMGEIYIGGDALARGYVNLPELTADTFDLYQDFLDDQEKKETEKRIGKNPSTSLPLYPSTPLYRTGDLGLRLPDGNIEFLGRIDSQVKIRGFRIELSEIENRLLKHEMIKETVVVSREEKTGDRERYLCAYVVPGETLPEEEHPGKERGAWSLEPGELREYLSHTLPGYMIPKYFVKIETIPLTPNGKINQKALPAPNVTAAEAYAAPRDQLEETIAEIWAGILNLNKGGIGIHDNFFEIGGDSLKLIRVNSQLKKSGIPMDVGKLFSYQTIADISTHLHLQWQSESPIPESMESFPAQKEKGLNHHITKQEEAELSRVLAKNAGLSLRLVENKMTREYPVSPVQKSILTLGNHKIVAKNNILASYDFHQTLHIHDLAEIKKVLTILIKENSLLRSIIVEKDGCYWFREFDAFSNIELPYMDISGYSSTAKQGILNTLHKEMDEPFELMDHLLYRLMVLKWDQKVYKIIFTFNHLIFDGRSVRLLPEKIEKIRRRKPPADGPITPKTDYYDYCSFMNRLDYRDVRLEKYLDIDGYRHAIEKAARDFNPSGFKNDGFDLDISMMKDGLKDLYNEIILLAYAKMINDLFGISQVPINFISQGRHYKDGNFNEVIGDFHDFIPVFFPVCDGGPGPGHWQIIENFLDFRKYIKEMNLNFLSYFVTNDTTQAELSRLSSPFSFNSLIGLYTDLKGYGEAVVDRSDERSKLKRFYLEMAKAPDSDRIWIACTQNSQFEKEEVKETFMKHFYRLVEELGSTEHQTAPEKIREGGAHLRSASTVNDECRLMKKKSGGILW